MSPTTSRRAALPASRHCPLSTDSMWVLWPLVICLLCLAARPTASSSTQCSWQDLNDEEFSKVSQKIQIKAKYGQNGTLTVKVDQADDEYVDTIQPPDPYTLSMTCKDNSCTYNLDKNGENLRNITSLAIAGPQKFIVKGENLEWSQNCTAESTKTTMTPPPPSTTQETNTPTNTSTTLSKDDGDDNTTTHSAENTSTTLSKDDGDDNTTTHSTENTSTDAAPTTTITTTTQKREEPTSKPKPAKRTSTTVILALTSVLVIVAVLGVCLIYRHRLHTAALDIQSRARLLRSGAREVVVEQGTPV